jgi:16S rRNA (uracil1498-N3)-methyltransferase
VRRFYAPPERFTGGRVRLGDEEAHHICRVLRLGPGDKIHVFDGLGHEYLVEIEIAAGRVVSGRVLAEVPQEKEAPLSLALAQGLAKGDKLELVIQKATEIGVKEVIPVHTARSVLKISEGTRRTERWQRIAREASKQCGRTFVPRVESVTTLEALSARFKEFDAVLIFWEEERARRLRAALAELAGKGKVRRLLILVGPEGGFTQEEVDLVVEAGALPVTLGPRILRTETAGLVAASIILYELGDLG